MDDARSQMTNPEDGSHRLFIGGEWRASSSAESMEERSPIDDSIVGRVAAGTVEDVGEAIKAAAAAWPAWEEVGFSARADVLHAAAELMRREQELLTGLLVEEIAKPKGEARTCVERTAGLIDYFAEEGRRFYGEIIFGDSFPGYGRDKVCQVYREPQGVVVAISPFNYPLNLSASKIAPALITGNAVVFKPSINGAIVALHLVELFRQAGVPAGVLNAVTGRSSQIGDPLVAHPLVNMVAFTGSTSVGKHIALTAGMIPLMLELGGKDAALVLEDADLDLAAREIVGGAFSYAGQRCTAVKRVIVVEAVAEGLLERLKAGVAKVKLGDPRDESVTMGPLISDEAAEFVQGLVDDAVSKGAQVLCGGKRDERYIEATLLDRVSENMRLAWEEPFGPVLPVLRVGSLEEAIRLANASEYGLQSCVFTRDIDKAFYVGRKLDVGTVNINGRDSRGPDHFPFVGRKGSGLETQGVHYSITAMTKTKAITLNLRRP